MRILQVDDANLLAIAHTLFVEYAEQLGHDLCFQDFQRELATLPGAYAPPSGCLLLVKDGDEWIGCVGMRKSGDGICEMKRMYVRPRWRRRGVARQLALELIRIAKGVGYERMRLDTLAPMTPARQLYESLGFRQVEAYYDNPIPGAVYYELDLRSLRQGA